MRKSADGVINALIVALALGALILVAVLAATGSSLTGGPLPFEDQYRSQSASTS